MKFEDRKSILKLLLLLFLSPFMVLNSANKERRVRKVRPIQFYPVLITVTTCMCMHALGSIRGATFDIPGSWKEPEMFPQLM